MSDEFVIGIEAPGQAEVLTSSVNVDEQHQGEHVLAPPPGLVDESTVRMLLRGLGGAAHAGAEFVVPEADTEPLFLTFTEAELDALTPPLTSYINARPKLAAAAANGDGIAVLLALSGWAGRNAGAWRRISDLREDLDDEQPRETEQVPSQPAPGSPGPGGLWGQPDAGGADEHR